MDGNAMSVRAIQHAQISEMVAAGTITDDEAQELRVALDRKRGFFDLISDPSQTVRPLPGLILSALIAALSVVISVYASLRFDGTLDTHFSPVTWSTATFDVLISTLSPAIFFWGAGQLLAHRGHLIDYIVGCGIARVAALISGMATWGTITLFPFDPTSTEFSIGVVLMAFLALPLLVWQIAMLFRTFQRESCLEGGKLVLAFTVSLIGAEIFSKLVIYGVGA